MKLNDADLVGFPFQIRIGPKKLKEGKKKIGTREMGAAIVAASVWSMWRRCRLCRSGMSPAMWNEKICRLPVRVSL